MRRVGSCLRLCPGGLQMELPGDLHTAFRGGSRWSQDQRGSGGGGLTRWRRCIDSLRSRCYSKNSSS